MYALALNKSENKKKRPAKEGGREMEQKPDQMVTKDFLSVIDKKECQLCHSTETPRWRKGPKGPNGPLVRIDRSLAIYMYPPSSPSPPF